MHASIYNTFTDKNAMKQQHELKLKTFFSSNFDSPIRVLIFSHVQI